MNWPKVLIGWAAVLCPAATSAQPAVSAVVPGNTSEPLVAVIVNERAYQTALTLAECMQAFKPGIEAAPPRLIPELSSASSKARNARSLRGKAKSSSNCALPIRPPAKQKS